MGVPEPLERPVFLFKVFAGHGGSAFEQFQGK